MPNRLKSYVRRTIVQAAKDYSPTGRRTPESIRSACMDATCGTDTGWWNDLIYTAPKLEMAHRYRRDVAAALEEYRDETGESFVYRPGYGEPETNAEEILTARRGRKPPTIEDFAGDASNPDSGRADCYLIGLRFAVEWYAGEVTRDLCPDL